VLAATLSGTSWAYLDQGGGPAVLLGHGLLSDHRLFDAQIAALSGGHRCLAVDWPGHGGSGFDPRGWTVADLARDAGALLDAAGVERAVLAGIGLGAIALLALAVARPPLVAGLVLIGAGATAERWPLLAELERRRDVLRHGDDAERSAAVDALQAMLHSAAWHAREPERLLAEKQRILGADPEGRELAVRALAAAGGPDGPAARLGEIAAPTVVVEAGQDAAVAPGSGRALAAAIPGAELVRIEGAGHHAPLEAPDAVTRALERALAARR